MPKGADLTILAIIPARGGSKGLPRKNVLPLDGFPLIAYAIAAAQQSNAIDRVIVSTDDEEIAAVSRQFDAEVPFMRPAELAGDFSTDLEVFQHVLKWLDENEQQTPDIVFNVRATSPLRTEGMLDEAAEKLFQNPDLDSVRSVIPAKHTPFKMWQKTKEDLLEPLLKVDGLAEPFNQPRQKLPQCWWQTGQVDAVRASVIMQDNGMSGSRIGGMAVDTALTIDIDGPSDLVAARDVLKENPSCIRPHHQRS